MRLHGDGTPEGPVSWAVATPENQADAKTPETQEAQFNPEKQALEALNTELDGIENDSKLVSSYTSILGGFLQKVKNGEMEWLSPNDNEFQQLLELYERKFRELETLGNRGHDIEWELAVYAARLNSTVDSLIDGGEGDLDDQLEQDLETQEEVSRLEIQKDSLIWIIGTTVRELPKGATMSEETVKLIAEVTEINKAEIKGTLNEQNQQLSEMITKLEEIRVKMEESILRDTERFQIKEAYMSQEVVYEDADIPELVSGVQKLQGDFRSTVFEQILNETDEGKALWEYKEHETIKALESETEDGMEFGYDVARLLEEFDSISIPEEGSAQEQWEALAVAFRKTYSSS